MGEANERTNERRGNERTKDGTEVEEEGLAFLFLARGRGDDGMEFAALKPV